MMHSRFKVIGKVVDCQQHETTTLLYSFHSFECLGIFFELFQIVELSCRVNLDLLILNDATFDMVNRLLGVAVKSKNFIFYEIWNRCVLGFHLILPHPVDLFSLQTSESSSRRNVLGVAFRYYFPSDWPFDRVKLYCLSG
jgi:hypothetical protein